MRHIAFAKVFAVCICFALTSFGVSAEPQRLRGKTFEILDREGFGRSYVAHTITLPRDWRASGRIAWNKPCSSDELFETVFKATSPDGLYGARIAPGHQIIMNEFVPSGTSQFPEITAMMVAQTEADLNRFKTQFRNTNCHVAKIKGTRHLVDGLVLRARPSDAEVRSIAVQKPLKDRLARDLGQLTQIDPTIKTYHDAVAVTVSYNTRNGPVDEEILLMWTLTLFSIPGPEGTLIQHLGHVFPIYSSWAPKGKMTDARPLFDAIWGSFKANPEWTRKVRKARQDLAEQRRKQRKESWDAHQEAMKERSEAQEKSTQDFIDIVIWERDPDAKKEKDKAGNKSVQFILD